MTGEKTRIGNQVDRRENQDRKPGWLGRTRIGNQVDRKENQDRKPG